MEHLSWINFQIIIAQSSFGCNFWCYRIARKLCRFWKKKKKKKTEMQQFWKWLRAYSQQFLSQKGSSRNPSTEAVKGWGHEAKNSNPSISITQLFLFLALFHFVLVILLWRSLSDFCERLLVALLREFERGRVRPNSIVCDEKKFVII